MKTFLVIVAALSFGTALAAEPVSSLKPFGNVNDFAGVLNNASIAQLDEACRQIDTKANAQIVVVTVNSLDGADIYDYSLNLFRTWGIGSKATNRGVLILVATGDHRYRITIGKGLDSILSEGNVSGFGLEAVPFLRRGDYGGAISLMTSRVAGVIAQDAGIALPAIVVPAPQPEPQPTPVPRVLQEEDNGSEIGSILFVVLICAVAFVIYVRRRSAYQSDAYVNPNNISNPVNTYNVGTVDNSLTNAAIAASLWNATDPSGQNSVSVPDASPPTSFGGDSGGSCGGGDTSGGGAGGSW